MRDYHCPCGCGTTVSNMEPRTLMLARQSPAYIRIMASGNNASDQAFIERLDLEVFMRNNGYKGQE